MFCFEVYLGEWNVCLFGFVEDLIIDYNNKND